jgi:hypothetical protein
VSRFYSRPEDLGVLEYLARLALGPLILVLLGFGFGRGWGQVWTPAALMFADILLAVRWREFAPIAGLGRDPGGSLGPLSKLVMVGALILAPLMLAGGELLVGLAVGVMAVAGAGLWLGWPWAGWVWIAYGVTAMADWLGDLASLVYEAVRAGEALPMARWKPLLGSLPSALFAGAVLTWVLAWRRSLDQATEPEVDRDPPSA